MKIFKKLYEKFLLRPRMSKAERLIYLVIFLWVVFGVLGIVKTTNLTQLAGYYASLTLFVSTYLWGEWRRSSNTTPLFVGGPNSSREITIYVVVLLWTIVGIFGIFYMDDLNPLTVYFSALSPFVMSYIIYKTTKGEGNFSDLPIFSGQTQELVDKARNAADISKGKDKPEEKTNKTTVVQDDKKTVVVVGTEEPKDKQDFSGYKPEDDSEDVTDGI